MRLQRSGLALALLAAAALASSAACGGDDGATPASAWPSYFTLAELVDASDIIVVARLGDERTITVEAPPAADGSTSTAVEVVRAFVVEESLRGDLLPGDIFNVFNTASVAKKYDSGRDPSEVVYQVLRIEPEQSYLLFLTLVELPDFYPDDLGDFGWAAPGEPHTARVQDNGTLMWETTGRYDDALAERNIQPGIQGAAPAFDLTVQVVASLAGQQQPIIPATSPSATP